MPTATLLDYMGTRLDAEKAQGRTIGLNIILQRDEQEECSVLLRNSVINNRAERLKNADATLVIDAKSLAALITGMVSYSQVCGAERAGTAHKASCAVVEGNAARAEEFFSLLAPPVSRNFPLVAPDKKD
jgi:alkyl sulfatase BDS1-like metallo-beta-lactamase superfamily hydrolase